MSLLNCIDVSFELDSSEDAFESLIRAHAVAFERDVQNFVLLESQLVRERGGHGGRSTLIFFIPLRNTEDVIVVVVEAQLVPLVVYLSGSANDDKFQQGRGRVGELIHAHVIIRITVGIVGRLDEVGGEPSDILGS